MSEGGDRSMTVEEAVRVLRRDEEYAELIRDAYLGEDVIDAAERFAASAEFEAARQLLGARHTRGRVLDLGAGRGIASYAFAQCGADLVYALEPDPSGEVGRGAIDELMVGRHLPIEVLNAFAEEIPLRDESVDVVYARQVFHHVRDLSAITRECARVLRPGGALLVCREHVVDSPRQLVRFLASHPVHRLAGGEHAYRLADYVLAIKEAGLHVERVLGPWHSVINAFPLVRDEYELDRRGEILLRRRLGGFGRALARISGPPALVRAALRFQRMPGRMYSFFATKPLA